MSGVLVTAGAPRSQFWKCTPREAGHTRAPTPDPVCAVLETKGPDPAPAPVIASVELRIELAPRVVLSLSSANEHVTVSPLDVRAIRAAAAPLLAELASRQLAADPDSGGDE